MHTAYYRPEASIMINQRHLFLRRLIPSRPGVKAGLAGLLVGCVVGFIFILWNDHPSPVVINSAYELDRVVHRDGHLDLVFNIDRVEDCPAESSRWLWTWVERNGVRMKQFFPLTSSNTTVTESGSGQHFILSLQLPPGLWAGDWYYFAKTIEHCSLLPVLSHYRVLETPQIPIRIIDP